MKFKLPVIIKPVDSSGSKGVTVLHSWDNFEAALKYAFEFSRTNRIIIEEYIEKKHPYLIGGDIFISCGKIVLWGLLNCHRDNEANPLVPVGKSYPLQLENEDINNVKDTLQQIVDKLNIQSGAMNVELIVDKSGRVWPIDIGPRNGGNMIPDLLGLIFNVNIVEWSVKSAMNVPFSAQVNEGIPYYATHNLHTNKCGIYKGVKFSDDLLPYIVQKNIYKNPGDYIERFDNASKALGIIFIKFQDSEQMNHILKNINQHIFVEQE